jgi:hypothetical protein
LARLAHAAGLYKVTGRFGDECLRDGGSLFTPGREIWSPSTVGALYERVVEQPDESKGVAFLDKLAGQLDGASPDVIQLAAEILYVTVLPQDRDPVDRRKQVERIVAISLAPVALPNDLVAALDNHVATYGAALIHKYWHFVFMLEFAERWVQLDLRRRSELVQNADSFQSFVGEVPHKNAITQVQALLHVVFPDEYESIVSVDVKGKIAQAFASHCDDLSPPLDKRLATIRANLVGTHGADFSFYDPKLLSQWESGAKLDDAPDSSPIASVDKKSAWLFQANLTTWDLPGALAALPALQWVARQNYRQIKPGDSVHFWQSGPQGGVVGRGRILTTPTEEPQDPSAAVFNLNDEFLSVERRVWIAVERVLEQPIPRNELLEHSVLRDMEIFRFANATNFRLGQDADNVLTALEGDRDGRNVAREKLFFITASGELAAKHLKTSLEDGIPLEQLQAMQGIGQQLERHAVDGRVYAWGARPGSAAEQKWERLQPGDVCLVYAKGSFPLWGRVYAKARSGEVARAIWGEHKGEIWECMYFLDPVELLGADRETVVTRLSYKGNYIPQGFEIPGERAQQQILVSHPTLAHFIRSVEVVPKEEKQRVWWVCQGTTYAEARDLGILWAPKQAKDGSGRSHWRSLEGARVGDLVLHYATGKIRAVSVVTERAIDALDPFSENHGWEGMGLLLRADYRELEEPVGLEEIPVEWRVEHGAPFTRAGGVQQGYFYELSDAFVWALAGRFSELGLPKAAQMTAAGAGYLPPDYETVLRQILEAGLRLDEQTVRRYHLSLQTRGFVVLSGLSGSGKTWLAQLYAESVGARAQLVAVAPNWTTNEDLLGYYDPLAREYRHTPFSAFLQAAADEWRDAQRGRRPAQPFHLILDEMNLARVECYFAKFLSAMEIRAREGQAMLELDATLTTLLTANLVFVGTINVDETTHGFADKIYDRAQLIEIEVTRTGIEDHLAGRLYATALLSVWDAMMPAAPFAYRILDEIGAYMDGAAELEVPWEVALDEQLLQKILPKIKGTEKAIGGALDEFIALAEGIWPLSGAKAEEMRDAFINHGFTSYF